jgi:hypothetical protein
MVAANPGEFGSEVSAAWWNARSAANHAEMICPSPGLVELVVVEPVLRVGVFEVEPVDDLDAVVAALHDPNSNPHTAAQTTNESRHVAPGRSVSFRRRIQFIES